MEYILKPDIYLYFRGLKSGRVLRVLVLEVLSRSGTMLLLYNEKRYERKISSINVSFFFTSELVPCDFRFFDTSSLSDDELDNISWYCLNCFNANQSFCHSFGVKCDFFREIPPPSREGIIQYGINRDAYDYANKYKDDKRKKTRSY